MSDDFDDDGSDDELPGDGEGTDGADPKPGKDDYPVGYRKPPKHSQFKPGQSGNPRGRKKGSRGLKTDLHAELNRVVEVTFGEGKYRFKGTTQQLMLRALALLAANGNLKASGQLVPLILSVFGAEDRRTDKRTLSPQDQAVLDNFLAAFGGDAASSSNDFTGKPTDPDESADQAEGEP